MKRYRDEEREAVLILRRQGLVPLAIADELGIPDSTLWRHLRSLVRADELEPIPSYI
jgi:uncharacterized membrane protein